jgi:hypothetical protein
VPPRVVFVLGLVVALSVGCGTQRACTLMGGLNGVAVEIPESLFVQAGSVRLEVCDDHGCATTTQVLGQISQAPVARGAAASFNSLQRQFSPGRVRVTATLSGPDGELIASRQQEVELVRSYPNGKSCDSGFVSGRLTLQPGDRSIAA